MIMPSALRMSSIFHRCPRSSAPWLPALGIILQWKPRKGVIYEQTDEVMTKGGGGGGGGASSELGIHMYFNIHSIAKTLTPKRRKP